MNRYDQSSDLLLISQGKATIYGFYEDTEGNVVKATLLHLPEKSWYGDFNIFFDEPSHFYLEAFITESHKNSKNKRGNVKYVEILKLNGQTLRDLSRQYTDWRQFLTLRATRRLAYFMHQLE